MALLLLLACSSNDPETAPTATPQPPPGTLEASPIPPTAAPDTITVDNLDRLRTVASVQVQEPQLLTWRADDEALFIAGRRQVSLLPRRGGEATNLLSLGEDEIVFDISPQGLIAVAPDRRSIFLRDAGSGLASKVLTLDADFGDAHFSPDGTLLAVTLAGRIAVKLFDVQTGVELRELSGFETAAPVYSVKFGPGGRSLIWYSRAKSQVMDLATGELGPAIATEDFLTDLALSPEGEALATSAGDRLVFWDTVTGKALDTLAQPALLSGISYSRRGDFIALASTDDVRFLELPLAEPVGSLGIAARQVAISPAGKAIATVSEDGAVRIWAPQ
jgi:WD40 repeat protein